MDALRFAAFTARQGAVTDSVEANRLQDMNEDSEQLVTTEDRADTRPILIVPYMWIGDFVRGHTVVRVLKQRWPNRPIDLLTTTLCAPLVDYMPGVRAGIVWDLPRSRLAVARQWGLAAELRSRSYGTALVLPRTWKSAIAPALAGIPERVGFVGEARFGLINRWRWGEKALPRFIDKNAALALPEGAPLPPEWPVPQLERSSRGSPPLAASRRTGHRNRRGAGARLGGRLQALDLLSAKPRGSWPSVGSMSGWSAAPAKRRWPRRSSPRAGPRSAT